MMVYLALPLVSYNLKVFLMGIMLIYPPGFYVMYSHMIKQRRKALNVGIAQAKGKGGKKHK